jgi:hypothetical protein
MVIGEVQAQTEEQHSKALLYNELADKIMQHTIEAENYERKNLCSKEAKKARQDIMDLTKQRKALKKSA